MRAWASRASSAATRSTERLGCTLESNRSPGDEEQVDLLGDGEVHGGPERVELALPLGGGGVPEVRVPRAEMDVGRVQQSKHSVRPALPGRPSRDPHAGAGEADRDPRAAAPCPALP